MHGFSNGSHIQTDLQRYVPCKKHIKHVKCVITRMELYAAKNFVLRNVTICVLILGNKPVTRTQPYYHSTFKC